MEIFSLLAARRFHCAEVYVPVKFSASRDPRFVLLQSNMMCDACDQHAIVRPNAVLPGVHQICFHRGFLLASRRMRRVTCSIALDERHQDMEARPGARCFHCTEVLPTDVFAVPVGLLIGRAVSISDTVLRQCKSVPSCALVCDCDVCV